MFLMTCILPSSASQSKWHLDVQTAFYQTKCQIKLARQISTQRNHQFESFLLPILCFYH